LPVYTAVGIVTMPPTVRMSTKLPEPGVLRLCLLEKGNILNP